MHYFFFIIINLINNTLDVFQDSQDSDHPNVPESHSIKKSQDSDHPNVPDPNVPESHSIKKFKLTSDNKGIVYYFKDCAEYLLYTIFFYNY
jgi:hypothetical protein